MRLAPWLALAILLAPLAGAWSGFGGYEPSTPYDDQFWMWQDAPLTGNRIYFNVVSVTMPSFTNPQITAPPIMPNVGVLETQSEPPVGEAHIAIFGVWKDCNGDGYIGMAESALREYDARLLLDDSVCPATTGVPSKWTAGAHNYNNVVSEYVPISWWGAGNSPDMRIYQDPAARVWGDLGKPDAPPPGRTCSTFPLPRGTLATMGGFFNYLDCRAGVINAWNGAMGFSGDPLGWSIPDPSDARNSDFGRMPLLGEEDSSQATVWVSDCSEPSLLDLGLPAVPSPSPGVGDPTRPNAAATANLTLEAFADDCKPENDAGRDLYGPLESPALTSDAINKRRADWNFLYANGSRGQLPLSAVPGGYSGSGGVAADYGIGWGGTGAGSVFGFGGSAASRWWAPAFLDKTVPSVVRADLTVLNVEIAPSYWVSFYAKIGATSQARGLLTPGSEGTYGGPQCAESDSGIHNGWNCAAEAWNVDNNGAPIPDPMRRRAIVGDPYQLRDVDCYDGRIGETGIGVGLPYYGPQPC